MYLAIPLLSLLFSDALVARKAVNGYVVIRKPDAGALSLDEDDVRRVYLDKVTIGYARSLIALDLPDDHPVKKVFYELVIKKNMSQLHAYWVQRLFSGRGAPPRILSSEGEVLNYIKRKPGRIGYVSVGADVSEFDVVMTF